MLIRYRAQRVWIETKSFNGRLDPEQKRVHEILRYHEDEVFVTRTIVETWGVLNDFGVPLQATRLDAQLADDCWLREMREFEGGCGRWQMGAGRGKMTQADRVRVESADSRFRSRLLISIRFRRHFRDDQTIDFLYRLRDRISRRRRHPERRHQHPRPEHRSHPLVLGGRRRQRRSRASRGGDPADPVRARQEHAPPPLVDWVNRRPISERATEAHYRVHAVCSRPDVPDVRDLLADELEKANYPVREVETLSETEDQVELAASLLPTTAEPAELDAVVAAIGRSPLVRNATWTVETEP